MRRKMLFCSREKPATNNKNKAHIDKVLGRYKSEEFRNLIDKWVGDLKFKRVLKTDLREEAFGEDEILFSLSNRISQFFALDISEETAKKAQIRQREKGLAHTYITADVRYLSFKANTFDHILSTSTLDHFTTEDDFKKSLIELKRVVKPGGTMTITLNNRCNLIFYLMLNLERKLGLKSYPVQFYDLKSVRRICGNVGLYIQAEDAVVHIIGPINSILQLLRIWIPKDIVDTFAEMCVSFFKWLGNRKRSKFLTAWFIAIKCVK